MHGCMDAWMHGCMDGADPVLSTQHKNLRALSKPLQPQQLSDIRHSTQHGMGHG